MPRLLRIYASNFEFLTRYISVITNDNRPSAEASNCRCTTHLNYCGKSLGSFCSGGTRRSFESDSLYGCSVDHSPVKIRACSGGCQLKKVSENDVCSQPSVSAYAPDKDYLASGGKLLRGQTIWSTSKQTKLVLQHDGNLVVYRVASEAENSSDKPKWASGTNVLVGTPESVHLLQGGDLVMGNKAGSVVWRLGTEFEGASLRVLDENGGKVCLVTSRTDSECLWSS